MLFNSAERQSQACVNEEWDHYGTITTITTNIEH